MSEALHITFEREALPYDTLPPSIYFSGMRGRYYPHYPGEPLAESYASNINRSWAAFKKGYEAAKGSLQSLRAENERLRHKLSFFDTELQGVKNE